MPARKKRSTQSSSKQIGWKKTTRRPRTTKARRSAKAGKVIATKNKSEIIWKNPNNLMFPSEWFGKIVTRVKMSLAAATPAPWTASGGLLVYVNANSCIQPFQNITATGITYLTGYSSATVPVGFSKLCNANMYFRYQVTAFNLQVRADPAALGDSVLVAVTPSGGATVPANYAASEGQFMTKNKLFQSSRGQNNKLSCFVDISKYYGVDKKIFNNDAENSWSSSYNAAPANIVTAVCNLQMSDNLPPSVVMPFEMQLTQYIRFFDFSAANFA